MIAACKSPNANALVSVSTRVARHVVGKLQGSSRSLLLVDGDSKIWVAKFLNNPQHARVVINEYLGTRIAADLGLSVPKCSLISVNAEVFRKAQRAQVLSSSEAKAYEPGIAFASAYAGLGRWQKTFDFVPANDWHRVDNRAELAGMLVFDAWVQNTDRRQAVYVQEDRSRSLKAIWIDQGNCFGDVRWQLNLHSPSSLCSDNPVYASLAGWRDLEPWLDRVQDISPERIYQIVTELPSEWLGDQMADLEQLIADLDFRKRRLHSALLDLVYSRKRSFPAWPTGLRTPKTPATTLDESLMASQTTASLRSCAVSKAKYPDC